MNIKQGGITMQNAREMETVTFSPDNNNKNFFQKLMDIKVGPLPLPLYVLFSAIVIAAAIYNQLPPDMIGGFAIIMVAGFLLGDIGMKVPILKNIGGPAIMSLFIPSLFVFLGWMNDSSMEAVTTLMKTSNFLYFYISCLVAGSILGMHRLVLVQGFMRMAVPLIVGTISAVVVGVLVGMLFGYDPKHTLFFIVVPIISGGIGEGILPLSLGYSQILDQPSTELVSQLIPAAIIGNVCAIICAGYMKNLGEKKPHLNGQGMLVKTGNDEELLKAMNEKRKIDFSLMGAGLLIACTFFITGSLVHGLLDKAFGLNIPGPIVMIFAAALVKIFQLLPKNMEDGTYNLYKFISTNLTWPLMVGLGLLYIPLEDVAAVLTVGYVVICASVVLAMVTAGFFVGKLMKMYPVESAIVTGCHSGLGGTGDVAILSASNRMGLMPFAQVSTRIGGAVTVILATLLLGMFM
ncbi:2-hydroxycarboxylate transporter family protein [Priestia endophytica]|uniref:2-hydroxycarboxylate transporter family protein n=1 Tax=Priestia endophytica TaxID=135735 RepID=UPI002E1DA83C|nr:2-hydroxycarboxylate transporter family protein [Priestia endophytica]